MSEKLHHDSAENPEAKKWENLTKNPAENAAAELSADELKAARQRFLQSEIDQAPEMARMHAENLVDTENAFSKRLTRLEQSGSAMTKTEFEKWEDDFSFDWRRMYAELEKVGVTEDMGVTESAMIEADTQEQLMITEQNLLYLPKGEREEKSLTIEANAGHFYNERSIALIQAIKDAGGPAADDELATVHSLYRSASEHLAYKYPIESTNKLSAGISRSFDNMRTRAHNNLIKNLNEINNLAKKYGTKPLTPRNFWPSDRPQPTGAIRSRMRADRDIVEAFVNIAFSDEVDRVQRNQERARSEMTGMF